MNPGFEAVHLSHDDLSTWQGVEGGGDLNLTLAGLADKVTMLEAGARQVPDEVFAQALRLAQVGAWCFQEEEEEEEGKEGEFPQ